MKYQLDTNKYSSINFKYHVRPHPSIAKNKSRHMSIALSLSICLKIYEDTQKGL
jgi:hypothetical protein